MEERVRGRDRRADLPASLAGTLAALALLLLVAGLAAAGGSRRGGPRPTEVEGS